MNDDQISKRIRLPAQIINILEKEAEQYGYKFSEWTKIVLTERAIQYSIKENSNKDLVRKIISFFKKSSKDQLPHLRNDNEINDFIDTFKKD